MTKGGPVTTRGGFHKGREIKFNIILFCSFFLLVTQFMTPPVSVTQPHINHLPAFCTVTACDYSMTALHLPDDCLATVWQLHSDCTVTEQRVHGDFPARHKLS